MLQHTITLLTVFMEFITSIFKDMCSFRNKLTVFVCIFVLLVIWLNRNETAIILSAIAFLDSYLIYYLHNRKKNDPKP